MGGTEKTRKMRSTKQRQKKGSSKKRQKNQNVTKKKTENRKIIQKEAENKKGSVTGRFRQKKLAKNRREIEWKTGQ